MAGGATERDTVSPRSRELGSIRSGPPAGPAPIPSPIALPPLQVTPTSSAVAAVADPGAPPPSEPVGVGVTAAPLPPPEPAGVTLVAPPLPAAGGPASEPSRQAPARRTPNDIVASKRLVIGEPPSPLRPNCWGRLARV